MQFKLLDEEQIAKYRQWARDNYKPFSDINGTWHPVVQITCVDINIEHATFTKENDDE